MSLRSNIIIIVLLLMAVLASAAERDSDLDGIPDSSDDYPFDYDNDGMPDIWEKKSGLRYDAKDADEDPDNDGVINLEEYKKGTNPLVSDATGERTAQELKLSPVESNLVRILIWVVAILLITLIILLAVYRTHIMNMIKYVHKRSEAPQPRPQYQVEGPPPLSRPPMAYPTVQMQKPIIYPKYQPRQKRRYPSYVRKRPQPMPQARPAQPKVTQQRPKKAPPKEEYIDLSKYRHYDRVFAKLKREAESKAHEHALENLAKIK